MLSSQETLRETGLDGAALKPSEVDITEGAGLPFDLVTIDYEGREHFPDPETLRGLAGAVEVRVTVPVRADGFDPLGDDRRLAALPDAVDIVAVAGHPAYLDTEERTRSIASRFGAAVERAPRAWVGTEGVERIALATGATQFLLCSPTVERELGALRAAGFSGDLAVYAPTAFTEDEDAILDAVGEYVARRGIVRRALPEDAPTDRRAGGQARETLLSASADYALAGDPGTVAERVAELKGAGADYVIGYPARGLAEFAGGE